MKKILSVLIMATMVFTMAACGNSNDSVNTSIGDNNRLPDSQAAQSAGSDQESSQPGADTTSDTSGKTIIVYFSASGNTKRVAELVADELGGDLFELVPVEPYSEADQNWRDRDSRVCREHDDTSLQDIPLVSTEVPDWSEYDVILLGYPLWWREAAWPVNNFIRNNDFTGKTVIPFCTSTSSGFGDSGKLLEEMAGTGNWMDGNRFSEHADEESIREWVRGLDLE